MMKKTVIAELDKCYSIAPLTYHGKPHFLVAAEKQNRCILFDVEGNEKETVWEQPGGTMSMVQVPGSDGQFLATHKFYSPNDSKEAKIIIATPEESGEWGIKTLVDLPFVHRFDIIRGGNENYLIACTLKSGHEYKDDWRAPGKIYTAKLPAGLSEFNENNQLKLTVLKDGMLKNHGYCKVTEGDEEFAVVCGENGVFRCYPPKETDGPWTVKQLLDTPASDAVMADLDGDGEKELLVLSPFHGDTITIYKSGADGFTPVYVYPQKAEFLHAIWCGKIAGKTAAVVGHRKGIMELLAFLWDEEKKEYTFYKIDEGRGPANVYAYSHNGEDILIAANRETDEVAMYIFEKGDL